MVVSFQMSVAITIHIAFVASLHEQQRLYDATHYYSQARL